MPPTVLNIGSLNIDRVLRVPRIARPGQTIAARAVALHPGGKGANQSVALARAGARVRHVGRVGQDGRWLIERLTAAGVDASAVVVDAAALTGEAVIQVDDAGQNSIVIHGGANVALTTAQIDAAITGLHPGDTVVLQNETNLIGYAINAAADAGLNVALNPAPMTDAVHELPLDRVGLLIVNETEGESLVGATDPARIIHQLHDRFGCAVVLTRGGDGAMYHDAQRTLEQPAVKVEPVDTTAAGDTFVGYFVASRVAGLPVPDALRRAARAAALCVTRPGAIDAVPPAAQVDA